MFFGYEVLIQLNRINWKPQGWNSRAWVGIDIIILEKYSYSSWGLEIIRSPPHYGSGSNRRYLESPMNTKTSQIIFYLIAIGTNFGRYMVSFWHWELWDGLGSQCILWLVDGCIWKPMIIIAHILYLNHPSNGKLSVHTSQVTYKNM